MLFTYGGRIGSLECDVVKYDAENEYSTVSYSIVINCTEHILFYSDTFYRTYSVLHILC